MTINVPRRLAPYCLAALATACCGQQRGRTVDVRERPSEGGSSGAAEVDPYNPEGGAAGVAGSGPMTNALTVHVEDVAGLTIDIITLACDERCADIVAVARGGHPEYAYRWEDGSTDPARDVCLDADGGSA